MPPPHPFHTNLRLSAPIVCKLFDELTIDLVMKGHVLTCALWEVVKVEVEVEVEVEEVERRWMGRWGGRWSGEGGWEGGVGGGVVKVGGKVVEGGVGGGG